MMAALFASTVAFFAASYLVKRWLEANDIPRGMTRGMLVFTIALAAAYAAGWLVEHLA